LIWHRIKAGEVINGNIEKATQRPGVTSPRQEIGDYQLPRRILVIVADIADVIECEVDSETSPVKAKEIAYGQKR
jgi:hypothetical protein